jgi:hypothetical protein
MTTLRLFPLGTILFPNMILPLQVFEERYKILIANCIEDATPFGVVSIKSGNEVGDPSPEIHMVGTTAKINKTIFDKNGVILLEALGVQRFQILEIINDKPYLTAQVKPLNEIESSNVILLNEMQKSFEKFLQNSEIASGSYAFNRTVPKQSGELADRIAAKSIAFWDKKKLQLILENLDEESRLEDVKPIMNALSQFAESEAKEKIRKLKAESIHLN